MMLRKFTAASAGASEKVLFHYIARREEFEGSANELFNLVTSGTVRIKINQRFALKDAADGHKALEARATLGFSVLTV